MAKHLSNLFLVLLFLAATVAKSNAGERRDALPAPPLHAAMACERHAHLPDEYALHSCGVHNAATLLRNGGERNHGSNTRDTSFPATGLYKYYCNALPVCSAVVKTHGRYTDHVLLFLKGLLYPKHSFW